MNKVAKFEKVSFEQFKKDFGGGAEAIVSKISDADCGAEAIVSKIADAGDGAEAATLSSIYNAIELPTRATAGSAGYDFHTPFDINLEPGKSVRIITGIRARIDSDWVLMICPRSGLGYKFRVQLDNTVGIIDSDYYGSDNEGHIMIKITNDSREGKTLSLKAGERFAQGIFLPYGITEDDSATATRNGGFGSTK